MTQEQLAEALNVGVSSVGRWERGRVTPHPRQRVALAEVFGVSLADVDDMLSSGSGLQAHHVDAGRHPLGTRVARRGVASPEEGNDAVDRRQFAITSILAAVGLPAHVRRLFHDGRERPVTTAEVDALRLAIEEFERSDAAIGGGLVADAAITLHDELSERLRVGSSDTHAYRSLQTLHADIASWVGWLAYDAGHLTRSRSFLSEAITHARMIGDPATEARSMAYYCLVLSREHRYAEMLQCAEAGVAAASSLGPERHRVTSLLHLRSASAHASLGAEVEFGRAIDRARDSLAVAGDAPTPVWLNFFSASEIEGLTAYGLMRLGEHDRAASSFAAMLDAVRPDYVRNKVWYTVLHAQAMYGAGETDAASEAAIAILPSASRLQSGRVSEGLDDLARALAPHAPDVAGAADFVDAYREVLR